MLTFTTNRKQLYAVCYVYSHVGHAPPGKSSKACDFQACSAATNRFRSTF